MSRIGRKPIEVPAGVTITREGSVITVAGPKGTLNLKLMSGIELELVGSSVVIKKTTENPETQNAFGLSRTLVANMVNGVATGFERALEINGVGYRASVSGSTVNLSLGFSHPIAFKLPEGVSAKVEKNLITVSGYNKQLVGQAAADLRDLKKPEPYKGKGIKYVEERIRRKAGKTAAKG